MNIGGSGPVRRLLGSPESKHFLSREECVELFNRILSFCGGGGDTFVSIVSRWTGTTRWAHNHTYIAAETQTVDVQIERSIHSRGGFVQTNRIDDDGLREAVQLAERTRSASRTWYEGSPVDPDVHASITHPTLWSDATFALGADARTKIAHDMIATALDAGVNAAGTVTLSAHGHAVLATNGMSRYYPVTSVDCSMTARNVSARASGWAGKNDYDLARVDSVAIARTAVAKCRNSANPRSIEPGRYKAILEPQAVHDLVAPLVERAMGREMAEQGNGPFVYHSAETASKIGLKVADERLILSADPMDPEASFLPFDDDGTPFRAVTWIDRGVLRDLYYGRTYAVRSLGWETALPNSTSFRLSAVPDVAVISLEEMIANTERGILVTRFSHVDLIDIRSMLCSGFTRDGLWLIQDGKISMPITNFRFVESPLFIMNRLDAIGTPTRVFAPDLARMVPALAVRDFHFTSLADAV